jgi:hypothetical protein
VVCSTLVEAPLISRVGTTILIGAVVVTTSSPVAVTEPVATAKEPVSTEVAVTWTELVFASVPVPMIVWLAVVTTFVVAMLTTGALGVTEAEALDALSVEVFPLSDALAAGFPVGAAAPILSDVAGEDAAEDATEADGEALADDAFAVTELAGADALLVGAG